MRVGVSVPTSLPEIGGGWMLEADLFEALIRQISKSEHEFIFVGHIAKPAFALPDHLTYINLAPVKPIYVRGIHRFSRILRRLMNSPTQNESRNHLALKQNNIQFLMTLSPRASTVDVPYLMFVWDLEFLVQPYFPELSNDQEWDMRFDHYQRLLRRAALIVTGSTVNRAQITKTFQIPEERIPLIPHPTPSDALAYADSCNWDADRATGATFLYPAQFWPHKNHVTLLKAMRAFVEKYKTKATLLLCGSDHGNRAHVESFARKLNISEHIQFLGFLSRQELLKLYTQVDALVYPSTFGPENLPPLEAFALKCPVVASRIPGAEEQLGDAGILVDPYDHEGFADAMHRVRSNAELRTSLIQRGLQRARKWTSDDVIRSIFVELDRFEVIRELWP